VIVASALVCGCGRIDFDPRSTGVDAAGDDASSLLTYAGAVLEDTPVGYWRLGALPIVDEIGGASAVTLGGCSETAGTLVGDPDGALALDSTCVVTISRRVVLDGRTPFTVEAWVRADAPEFQHVFTYQLRNAVGPDDGIALLEGPSGMYGERIVVTDNQYTGFGPHSTPLRHVALRYDGQVIALYVDAVLATSMADVRDHGVLDTEILLGAFQRPNLTYGGHLDGVIDEVALYDRALPEDRLSVHFEIGTQGPRPR
jgi:hypothetical protein